MRTACKLFGVSQDFALWPHNLVQLIPVLSAHGCVSLSSYTVSNISNSLELVLTRLWNNQFLYQLTSLTQRMVVMVCNLSSCRVRRSIRVMITIDLVINLNFIEFDRLWGHRAPWILQRNLLSKIILSYRTETIFRQKYIYFLFIYTTFINDNEKAKMRDKTTERGSKLSAPGI